MFGNQEEEKRKRDMWRSILSEESQRKCRGAVTEACREQWAERKRLVEMANSSVPFEGQSLVVEGCELETKALEKMMEAKEKMFFFLCENVVDGKERGGLLRLRDKDLLLSFMSQEEKAALARVTELEKRMKASKLQLEELESEATLSREEIGRMQEQLENLRGSRRVLGSNFTNLERSLGIRRAVFQKEVRDLTVHVNSLKEKKKAVDAKWIGDTCWSIGLEQEGPFAPELQRELETQMSSLKEDMEKRLERLRTHHEQLLDKERVEGKREFEAFGREASKHLSRQYVMQVEAKKKAVQEAREKLEQERAALDRLSKEVQRREELAMELSKAEAKSKQIKQENAEFQRAKQVLKRLWSDHPSLLCLSPEVDASLSDASIRGPRLQETAQAMQAFLDHQVLPRVELPNQELLNTFQRCSEELERALIAN